MQPKAFFIGVLVGVAGFVGMIMDGNNGSPGGFSVIFSVGAATMAILYYIDEK